MIGACVKKAGHNDPFMAKLCGQNTRSYCAKVTSRISAQTRMGVMMVNINRQWCKGCGICVAFCPKKALSLDDEGKACHNPELCVECGMCEQYCPDLAVTVEKTGKAKTGKEAA